MKVLTTIKSLTELDIDLIDSNEAMLVLNNLPNVQILNGRSTKDDDEDEEEEEEENGDEIMVNDIDNNQGIKIHNKYTNEINRLNNLYPKIEEIEEYKNSENNSNYISESNNKNKINELSDKNENNENADNSEAENENNISSSRDKNNLNNSKEKEKKVTRNKNVLNDKEFNPKIDSNNAQNQSNDTSQNKQSSINSIKKKTSSLSHNNNANSNIEENTPKIEKERESFYEFNNSNNEKNSNFVIDISNEELNTLKGNKYKINSEFNILVKDFYEIVNSGNELNTNYDVIKNNYIEKLKSIEEKKVDIPNYYYLFLLNKKKMKIIQNMYNELISYIIKKNPELNKNNILHNLQDELNNTMKDFKELVSTLHNHIESFSENYEKKKESKPLNVNENTKYNNIIKEKDDKISSLEEFKEKILKNVKENNEAYEKKILNLETENKIMTEKIFSKANTLINSTISQNQGTINNSDTKKQDMNIPNRKFRSNSNEVLFHSLNNQYIQTGNNRSPIKLTENTNTLDIINTNGNILMTNSNIEKHQIISLKTLKDLINELYSSKVNYDIKCEQFKLPKETLEEHMYTFLSKKYGLKNLVIEWAKNIISGIKYYSKLDSTVLLFGKIMRNEQEENARFIIQSVSENIEALLLLYIKERNPLKLFNDINKIFLEKKNSELIEEEWKGIIYNIYPKEEAELINKKIENFISKDNERKKMELLRKYKNSRLNFRNNNLSNNNSYYMNTINSVNNIGNNMSINYFNNNQNINNNMNNSYMNTIGNVNNKLSRVEKYNMLIFNEENNILYKNFIKIILDHHIRSRDKKLKNFVEIFRSVDTNRDGIINEEEFSELIQKMKIFKEEDIENTIFQYLEKIDPFDNQKITFSDCIDFFLNEIIVDKDANGDEQEISVLDKVCFQDNQNKNWNNIISNNNENKDNDKQIELNEINESNK